METKLVEAFIILKPETTTGPMFGFHLGKQNDWKNLLDSKIISKINKEFKSEMSELGYI